MCRVHIVFWQSSGDSLRHVLGELSQSNEKVIIVDEMLSIGPIAQLHLEKGMEERFEWMKNMIKSEYDAYQQGFCQAINQIRLIPEHTPIAIWVSENSSEQTGLRYVLYLLKDQANKIKVINSSKVLKELFDRPNLDYTVRHTGEIVPEKLKKIYEQTEKHRPLEQDERACLENEWCALERHSDHLRIYSKGNLYNVKESYYDQFILESAITLSQQGEGSDVIRVVHLIGDLVGKLDQHLGDAFFEYRVKKLVAEGLFEGQVI